MKGTPDNTIILHWDECRMSWAELSWQDWVRFRGVGAGRQSLLAGAKAGEHYFLVCVLGHCGELTNVIPHKYVLSADARLVHGFDGLEEAERQEWCKLDALLLPTIEDSERYNELDARIFTVNLPPTHTCERCLVSRVRSPAVRAGSFFLLLESLVRPPGPTRTPDAYNCEDQFNLPAQIHGYADIVGGLR